MDLACFTSVRSIKYIVLSHKDSTRLSNNSGDLTSFSSSSY